MKAPYPAGFGIDKRYSIKFHKKMLEKEFIERPRKPNSEYGIKAEPIQARFYRYYKDFVSWERGDKVKDAEYVSILSIFCNF